MAKQALDEDEYWDGHNMANTIPFVDKGDELDNLIHGFDHGTTAAKKIYSKGIKTTKLAGFDDTGYYYGEDDDEMLRSLFCEFYIFAMT